MCGLKSLLASLSHRHLFKKIYSCFFIISHWKDLQFSKFEVLNLKKKKVKLQRLRSRADLNRRPFAQESFGLFTWVICDLTNAGGKKLETISVTATNYLYQHCACKRSTRTDTSAGIFFPLPVAMLEPAGKFSSPNSNRNQHFTRGTLKSFLWFAASFNYDQINVVSVCYK